MFRDGIVVIGGALILSGCASLDGVMYTPPTGIDLAELNVKIKPSNTTSTYEYQNEASFIRYDIKDADTCSVERTTSSSTRLGMFDKDSTNTKTNIPAGKPILVQMYAWETSATLTAGYGCAYRFIFNPKPGAKYEIQSNAGWRMSDVDKRLRHPHCDAVVYLINAQDGSLAVDTTQHELPIPKTEDNSESTICDSWDSYKR